MTLPTIEQLEAMLANTTPGPWRVVEYDAGDKDHWDNCPSIQAAPEYDCAIVHWDGFKQKYWLSARGQSEINGNAALIALTPTLAAQRIADAERIAELEAALTEARRAIGSHAAPDARLVPVEQLDRWMGYTSQHGGAANCLKEIRAIIRGQP